LGGALNSFFSVCYIERSSVEYAVEYDFPGSRILPNEIFGIRHGSGPKSGPPRSLPPGSKEGPASRALHESGCGLPGDDGQAADPE